MILERLRAYQFQNYDTMDVLFHPKVNVVTGLNGMGKTNLLDAVYYLGLGKSYFKSYDRHVVQKGKEGFRVEGTYNRDSKKDILEIKVYPGTSKEILLSGDKLPKIMDHVGNFPCVIVAPIDIQLMLEGSAERRRFMNNTLIQYDRAYAECVIKYHKLLKHRNALLKEFIEKRRYDATLIESLDEQMIPPAIMIHAKRAEMLEQLSEMFMKNYQEISGEQEESTIGYRSPLNDASFADILKENVQKDKILGRTSSGVHKDDIRFRMNGNALKNFSSQGQLKSFVLALKLAQYELLSKIKNVQPILLLDDVFDKLDRSRVSHLLELVSGDRYGQVFISDTNYDRVPKLLEDMEKEYASFSVSFGKIDSHHV